MRTNINIRLWTAKCLFLCAVTMGCLFSSATAQESQPINLETALKLGGANALTIQEFKQREELAVADLAKAKEWWLPDVYAGASIHQLWGNVMNGDGNIFTGVNRNNLWSGIGLNASWDFGDGVYKVNAARLKTEAAEYATQAEKNKALLQVVHAYYDFLAAQLYYKAYEQLAGQADTIAEQIAVQVKAGLRFESDELLARSNYNHLQIEMLNARSAYNNSSAMLVQLLNLDPNTVLVGVDSILIPIGMVAPSAMGFTFNSAYESRPELKSMSLMLQSLEEEKKTTTTGLLLPELQLGTYTSYFGDVIAPVRLRDMTGRGFAPTAAINASLMWRIPLGRLAYRGTLQQYDAKIHLQQNRMAQTKAMVNAEVIRAKQQIEVARAQIKLALEGGQLSGEALKQTVQRQQIGTVRPFEVLQAQEIYLKSRLDYLKAVATYNKMQYSYFVAIGNNL